MVKMIMTNYLFISIILDQKIFSPSRWILSDGTTHPLKGSKYFAKITKTNEYYITRIEKEILKKTNCFKSCLSYSFFKSDPLVNNPLSNPKS